MSPSTYQLLAQMIPSLFCDAQRGLPVIILHVCHCARSQQEFHGLWLVLYDAVMERCVPLLCPPVEAARVLDEEVDDVQRPARFLRDGVVQARLVELLRLRFGEIYSKSVWLHNNNAVVLWP